MKYQLRLLMAGILAPLFLHAQWTSQATGFTPVGRGLWDINIVDANTVWALAYNGIVGAPAGLVPEYTKTINGGLLFTPGTFPSTYTSVNISAINADTAWISVLDAAYSGKILRTTNGGASWDLQSSAAIVDAQVLFVYFWNRNEGVTVGNPDGGELQIFTTTNGGLNWTPVPGTSIPDLLFSEIGTYKSHCVIGNNIWFSTNKARIYHSSDKGLTWSVKSTNISMTKSTDNIEIAFWNINEGIARKYDYKTSTNLEVKKTSDGGETWNSVTITGTFFGSQYAGFAYVPGTRSTLVSASTGPHAIGSSYSNDGGETWTLIDTNVQHYITRFLDNKTGWSAGFSLDKFRNGIFKYSGQPFGITNTETGKNIFFNAYPNPSSGYITLHLANVGSEELTISIFDFLGKVVFEKLFREPGEFFMNSILLPNHLSGTYLLKASVRNKSVIKVIIIE